MGKYSDPGTGMSVTRTEAVYPLVAVAIDNNNKTSHGALKWAVEYLLKRGQTLVLVHVNTKGTSTGPVDSSGYKQPDAQLRELFLPYRCFCTRQDINCKNMVLDDMDVARVLIEFAQSASIEIIVLGSPPKGMLRRFKSSDVSQIVAKGAPDFCTVYIIGKEKISHQKVAIRTAPTVSPLRPQMGNPSLPKFESAGATAPPKWIASKADNFSDPGLPCDNSIKKYSDPGTGMSVTGTEAVYSLVAVAIDNNNKTSHGALKWAVEHLLKRGQTLVLVHVNTKGTSTGPMDSSGYKQPDAQLRELFLPYRCFCNRKDINCKDVVLDEMDVARALIEFSQNASIEIIVLGSPPKGMLRIFKSSDVPQIVAKGAPDFCTVYIIGKGKISHQKVAIRTAPTVSPLRPQMGNPSLPKFSAGATAPPKWMASKADNFSEPGLPCDNSIKSPFTRENSYCSSKNSYGDFSAFSDLTDISFIISGRPSVDRYRFQSRLSNGSESNLEHSFEMMHTPHRFVPQYVLYEESSNV